MKRAALLLALAATLARAETRPRYGGVVEATLLGAPATLDPASARTHAEVTLAGLVFDTLYRVGPDGTAVPQLAAAEPTYDEKRTTVYVPVKKGIKLHDGSELTPADVAASLTRGRTLSRWTLPGAISIKVDGDGVVLTLRSPAPDVTTLLALPQLAITKGGKAPGAERAIGTGPYVVDSFDRKAKKLVLRAFDDHFAGRPYLDQLTLTWYDTPDGEARRFETGKAQVSARGATAFSGARPTVKVEDVEGPASLLVYVGFGRLHREVLSDAAFRKALDLALARGGLVAITTGERVIPTRLPVPIEAGGVALDARGRASDVDAARAQLADAQKRVPELAENRLASLRLEIGIEDTRPDDREIAERVVLALDKLGIGAVITALPSAVLRDRVAKGTVDLWIGQLVQPLTATSVWWGSAFAAGGEELRDGVNPPAEFASHLPIVPLMFRSLRMWHPTNLRGLQLDVLGRPCYADLYLFGATTPNKGKP